MHLQGGLVEVDLLVLSGFLISLNLLGLVLHQGVGEVHSELDVDALSELTATWTAELEAVLLGLVVGDGVVDNLDRHLDGKLLVACNFLLDGDLDVLDVEVVLFLAVGESQVAAFFPGPVGVVSHLNIDGDGLTWHCLEDFVVLAKEQGAQSLPLAHRVAFALALTILLGWLVETEWALAFSLVLFPLGLHVGEDVLNIFLLDSHVVEYTVDVGHPASWSVAVLGVLLGFFHLLLEGLDVFFFDACLSQESVDFLLPHTTTSGSSSPGSVTSLGAVRAGVLATVMSVRTTTVATWTASHHLSHDFLEGMHWLLLRLLFAEDGHHDFGILSGGLNLKEGVLVAETFFAGGTVVEVLADSALESVADDLLYATAVASNVLVDNFAVLQGRFSAFDVFVFEDLHEDVGRLLIKLVPNEIFDGLTV